MADQRFSDQDPVEEILRLALRNKTTEDSSLRERLLASAAELGISEEQALAAQQEWQKQKLQQEELGEYRRHIKKEFFSHLQAYLMTNAILLMINLFAAKGDFWVKWPAGVWGIILIVHALVAIGQIRQPSGDEFEKFRRARKGEPDPLDQIVKNAIEIRLAGVSSPIRISKPDKPVPPE
jgi:hypothetical protein